MGMRWRSSNCGLRIADCGLWIGRPALESAIRNPQSAIELMFEFTIHATCGPARAGTRVLPHGTGETPAFMPVGTQGPGRTLSPADLHAVGAELVLANTYHLHVRPGEGVVERLGGRSEEHTSELQSLAYLVCRLLLEK